RDQLRCIVNRPPLFGIRTAHCLLKVGDFGENCDTVIEKRRVMSTVGVVGLGYVGLPLAVAFGKKFRTIGFDLSVEKVESYRRHVDATGEVSGEDLGAATQLTVTTDPAQLAAADIIVVAVPTPVDTVHQPDFGPLVSASTTVGKHMRKGTIVVYESTVYPGATEEVCIPVLERHSGDRKSTRLNSSHVAISYAVFCLK